MTTEFELSQKSLAIPIYTSPYQIHYLTPVQFIGSVVLKQISFNEISMVWGCYHNFFFYIIILDMYIDLY